jgi:broad specificity phosphatase PhoE
MGITVVVSSDLQRARATAQRVAPALALRAPIATDAGLREYDLGAWSGLTRSQIEAGWPGDIEAWREGRLFATPGGEQRNLFLERIRAALARVADAWPEERVLVVTHGGVISAVARDLGQPARRFTHLAGLWLDAGTEPWRAQAEVSLLGPARPASDQGEGIEVAQAGVMDTRGR